MVTENKRMYQRVDTAANWVTADPTLANGEIGVESDTGALKAGDGATSWNSKTYTIPPVVHDPLTGQFSIGGKEMGHTGERDVALDATSTWWNYTKALLIRDGHWVNFKALVNWTGVDNTSRTAYVPPAGFEISSALNTTPYVRVLVHVEDYSNPATSQLLYLGNNLFSSSALGATFAQQSFTIDAWWFTTSAWPSSLPGTEASAPFSL